MNTRRNYYASFALIPVLILIVLPDVVHAKSVYVIGEDEHPWDEIGAVRKLMDITSHSGWIGPREIDPEENLTYLLYLGTGRQAWLSWEPKKFFELFDLFHGAYISSGYFEAAPVGPLRAWTIFLDLGAPFGIHCVRFHPLEKDALWYRLLASATGRSYVANHPPQWMEIGVNEGDPKNMDVSGQPILTPVWGQEVGPEPVVDARFPVHPARYVGIRTTARSPLFNIDQLEIYGEGFVSESVYFSPIIDLNGLTNLGQIRWEGEKDPEAEIVIRTRSGMDDDPNVYWRRTEQGELSPLDEQGKELTKEGYEKLPSKDRGGITYDRDHWNFWSGAYPFEGGSAGVWVVSPSPCRYFQIQIEMVGDYEAMRRMDRIAFEYSQPVLAQQVLGEIAPTQVSPSERTTFHYAITPIMGRGDRGFDTLEIFTPIRADTVRSVRWEGVEIPGAIEYRDDPTRFVVRFPRVKRTWTPVEVDFDVAVLRYGTMFRGRVFDSTVDEVPQWVVPGDAHPQIHSSTLSVETALGDSLIVLTGVSPNPFTPNEDGVRDETWISYDLLQLTEEAPVRVRIYDLSGRLIRTLYAGDDRSGRYRWRWDGKDEAGKRVSPGIYLIRVCVEADALQDSKVGLVSVVY